MARTRFMLLSILMVACSDPAPAIDAGSDAAVPDAGPRAIEPFADLGGTSEGIALGHTVDGVPVLYVGSHDRIVRVAPDGVVGDFVSIHAPVGVAVRENGELLVCAKTSVADGEAPGIFAVTLDGTVSLLVPSGPGGTAFGLTNFVTEAPDHSIVFSDSGADVLYRADADGSHVAVVTSAISYPNGLAFSPDGATLYVASWDTTTLYALSFDASTGMYGPPMPAIMGEMNVDGVVATSTGGLVLVTSASGAVSVDPAMPAAAPVTLFDAHALTLPANGVFGDSAFGVTNLYVTSLARTSLYVAHTTLMSPP